MMSMHDAFVLVALHFITVHAPDGQEMELNIAEISSIRKPQEQATDQSHFAKGTNCIMVMTNGKFIGTTETCTEVIKRIAASEKE